MADAAEPTAESSAQPSRLNGLRWAAIALAGIVLVAWVRAYLSANDEFTAAALAQAAGDEATAVERYGYAMRWYTPFGETPYEAADVLWDIADDATARGDRTAAMRALRALRGGILSTRGLTCPFCDLLDPVNQKLAAQIAAEQMALGQPTIRGRSQSELVADHLALLRLDPVPDPGWSLLAICGFFAWVGGGFATIFRGLDAGLKRTAAFPWLAGLTALGFGGWLVGLWLA